MLLPGNSYIFIVRFRGIMYIYYQIQVYIFNA